MFVLRSPLLDFTRLCLLASRQCLLDDPVANYRALSIILVRNSNNCSPMKTKEGSGEIRKRCQSLSQTAEEGQSLSLQPGSGWHWTHPGVLSCKEPGGPEAQVWLLCEQTWETSGLQNMWILADSVTLGHCHQVHPHPTSYSNMVHSSLQSRFSFLHSKHGRGQSRPGLQKTEECLAHTQGNRMGQGLKQFPEAVTKNSLPVKHVSLPLSKCGSAARRQEVTHNSKVADEEVPWASEERLEGPSGRPTGHSARVRGLDLVVSLNRLWFLAYLLCKYLAPSLRSPQTSLYLGSWSYLCIESWDGRCIAGPVCADADLLSHPVTETPTCPAADSLAGDGCRCHGPLSACSHLCPVSLPLLSRAQEWQLTAPVLWITTNWSEPSWFLKNELVEWISKEKISKEKKMWF